MRGGEGRWRRAGGTLREEEEPLLRRCEQGEEIRLADSRAPGDVLGRGTVQATDSELDERGFEHLLTALIRRHAHSRTLSHGHYDSEWLLTCQQAPLQLQDLLSRAEIQKAPAPQLTAERCHVEHREVPHAAVCG